MANRVVSWVLTATDRTGAAFSSVSRKMAASRIATEENSRSFDKLDRSSERASKDMDRSAESTTRSGRSSRGASKDNDKLSQSFMKLVSAAAFLKVATSLLKFPAMAAGANLAAGAIRGLAAGAMALVSALGPAVGALAALPGLMSAVAGAAVTAKLATGGIGAGLKALSSQADNAGKVASTGASKAAAAMNRQEAAAEGVRNATRSLAQAAQQAADQVAAANRQVEQSQEALTEAQAGATRAQNRLSLARREAVEDIEALRRSVQRLALSEEDAIFAVEDAAKALAEARIWEGFAPNEDVFRRADLAYRKAVANLQEVQDERSKANDELADAEAKGVDGSEAVVDAMQGIVDAQKDVANATRDAKDAQADAARAQVEGNEAVAEAQYQLTRAIADAAKAMDDMGEASDAAGAKTKTAFDKLQPSAKAFATFLYGLKPQLDQLKESAGSQLFPALEKSITNLLPLLPMVNDNLAAMGGAMGGVAIKASELMASGPFAADMKALGDQNVVTISRMGDAGIALGSALRHIMIAAMPLVDWITKMIVAGAQWIEKSAAAGRESGRLTAFFERTREVLTTLGHILSNVGQALFNTFKGGSALGGDMLGALERLTAKWNEWTQSVEGKKAIFKFFDDARPVLSEIGLLIKDVAQGLFSMGDGSTDTAALISQIRTELLPAILRLSEMADKAFSERFISSLSTFVTLFGNLAGTTGSLTVFLGIMEKIAQALNWALENVPLFKEFVATFMIYKGIMNAIKVVDFVTGIGDIVTKMAAADGATKAHTISTKAHELATKASAAAQWLLNAAMSANPIMLVVIVIGLLIAAVVIILAKMGLLGAAWDWLKEKAGQVWGWIQEKIDQVVGFITGIPGRIGDLGERMFGGVRNSVGNMVGWVQDKFNGLLDWIRGIPGRIGEFLGGVGEALKGPFKAGLNGIIWLLNRFIDVALAPLKVLNVIGDKIGINIPNVPQIPQLATGGRVMSGGLAWVGEKGPELAYMPTGSSVYSNAMSGAVVDQFNAADYISRAGGSSQPVTPPSSPGKAPVTVNQTFNDSRVDAQGSADAIHWLLKTQGA